MSLAEVDTQQRYERRADEELAEAQRDIGINPDPATHRARIAEVVGDLAPTQYHRTDMGNAQRFVDIHHAALRFRFDKPTSGRWHAWDGKKWGEDDTGAVGRAAQATVSAIYSDAAKLEGDQREALGKWATQSENTSRLDAMIKQARYDSRIVIRLEDLDSDPWALNVGNGIVDLQTGELRAHDPSEMHSKIAEASLRPDAECPGWLGFLGQVLPDAEVQRYVQKLAGYSIAGVVGENVLPFPYGSGANGKSVFLNVLREVLGDYATEAAPNLLAQRREPGIPADVADLQGYRFVTATEVEGGRAMATDVMKRLTGESKIKARPLYGQFNSFRNESTIWLAANDRPIVDGLDEAIWRRLRTIPFTVTIAEADRDPDLIPRLLKERDGILGWLIEGMMLYHAEGLTPPDAVAAATADYRADSNPLAAWFEAECEPASEGWVSAGELRESYERYCRSYSSKPIPAKSAKWSKGLMGLGCVASKRKQVRGWDGVCLRRSRNLDL